jgi:hypothetical protein
MMLPRVQPIIPVRRKEPFDNRDWLFELASSADDRQRLRNSLRSPALGPVEMPETPETVILELFAHDLEGIVA